MAFKLVISDIVGVKVEGTVQEKGGVIRSYKFTLDVDRLTQDELKAVVADKEGTAFEFFCQHAKDWHGQKLVLGDDDKPAPFSLDALKVLFSISGMAAQCWQAYLVQVMATAKN